MPEGILLDNDVVLKICSYRLGNELVGVSTVSNVPPAVLGVARYTLLDVIKRSRRLKDKTATQNELAEILKKVQQVEPTDREVEIAADFEQAAQQLSMELDSGESQLFAILLERNALLLLTGDKRAIRALEQISPNDGHGRLACFEQLFAAMLASVGYAALRGRVCAEPDADKAISLSFSCSAAGATVASTHEGLSSYIRDIRTFAPQVLISTEQLLAIVA